MFSMNTDVGALIAKSVLAAVAAALLCAGLYALFGKSHTREGKKRKNHIVHGFQLGGGIVLAIILMASVVGGSQIAFGVVPGSTLSRWEGLFAALLAFVLVFLLIRWWAKYFAGWIGYSVWNGLLMVSTGHLLNNPSITVPRWWSVSTTAVVFVSALVCVRFANTDVLSRIDKASLMFWLVMFTAAIDIGSTHAAYRRQLGSAAMVLGCLALVLAWFYDRRGRHRHRAERLHPHATPNGHLA
jgi:hypothetical protein